MKKLAIIALAFVSLQGIAQERQRNHKKDFRKERSQTLKDLTPEQAATLQTKKMVLHLDLNAAQQKDIYKLNLANAKERQANKEAARKLRQSGERPSREARYESRNKRLDQQLAQKKQLKSILTKEQFEKLEKGNKHHKMKQRKTLKKRGKQKQRFKKS